MQPDELIEGVLTRVSGYMRDGHFVRNYEQTRVPGAPDPPSAPHVSPAAVAAVRMPPTDPTPPHPPTWSVRKKAPKPPPPPSYEPEMPRLPAAVGALRERLAGVGDWSELGDDDRKLWAKAAGKEGVRFKTPEALLDHLEGGGRLSVAEGNGLLRMGADPGVEGIYEHGAFGFVDLTPDNLDEFLDTADHVGELRDVTYHVTSEPEVIDAMVKEGPDIAADDSGRALWGYGFYTSSEPEWDYGTHALRVGVRTTKPLMGTEAEIDALRDREGLDDNAAFTDWMEAEGYDSLIVDWEDDSSWAITRRADSHLVVNDGPQGYEQGPEWGPEE